LILLYNMLFLCGFIMGLPFIIPAALSSADQRNKFFHRLGVRKLPFRELTCRHEKPVWIHALSVGEVLSAIPLIKGMRNRFTSRKLVFSVSTKTGFEVAHAHISQYTPHIFYFPYDLIFSVKSIIKKINPMMVIIVETDIWPNFMTQMKKQKIPVILVNSRLSQKSFSGYKHLGFFSKSLFNIFSQICVQSGGDAKRFINLGVSPHKINLTGNMKFEQASPDATDVRKIRNSLNIEKSRQVLIAGSTHQGEESILLRAFSMLKKNFPDLVFIIVPRNPDRAQSVIKISESHGFHAVSSTWLEKTGAAQSFDVIVVDTIGKLRKLYAIANIAFIGGTLVNSGGHNPLEPAAYSRPIIFGPHMNDFKEISKLLINAKAAIQVQNAADFCQSAARLLKNSKTAHETGERAFEIFMANKGALEKTLNIIQSTWGIGKSVY
jgi:3-deoxy-D-manno-octulosonic-acid transferase